MKYRQEDDEEEDSSQQEINSFIAGYVFFYPTLGLCKIIESQVTTELQQEELSQFETLICKILYVTNE